MTCNQLGGACNQEFTADTFEAIAALSQEHGKAMFAMNEAAHMAAMSQMMELMKTGGMESWMAARRAEFEA